MAALCDVFVMDAFGTAHRAEASTHGVARFAPVACAGPLLVGELEALERALQKPARPLVAIVGGSKVSTKLTVLESLLEQGRPADRRRRHRQHLPRRDRRAASASRCARPTCSTSRGACWSKARARGTEIPLPTDVVVAREFAATAHADVRAGERGARRRDDPRHRAGHAPSTSRTIAAGRRHHHLERPGRACSSSSSSARARARIAQAIARSKAFSLAGGGDTLAAIEKYGVEDSISYISTGGGAFLEFVEGKTLPAVAVLEERARG